MRAKSRPSAPTLFVRPCPGAPTRALVTLGSLTFPAAIGRSGRTVFKREGDGATPRATMEILYGYWRPDHRAKPVTALTLHPIRSNLVWCDAPGHPLYNKSSRLPVAGSVEQMTRPDRLYDICLVMDWNIRRRAQGRGSAIFFHLARPGYLPTEGCVAISARNMERLIKVIGPRTRVVVL